MKINTVAQRAPKAIETIYGGYRFRSRLEARFAVFFDALGVEWEYEKEGYDLGSLGWYLPDFWLPRSKYFVEVKGDAGDQLGIAKALYLDAYPPQDANGNPVSIGCFIFSSIEYPDWEPDDEMSYFYQVIAPDMPDQFYNDAVTKARQARFEHGVRG